MSSQPQKPRPTGGSLYDVARLAGVSTASVSRTINAPEKVSSATRTRVEAAAAQLGYVPNIAARMLAARRSWTVAVIVPTLRNDVFARALEAIQARLAEASYSLLVGYSDYSAAREAELVRIFLARGVDAFIFMGAIHRPGIYATLTRQAVPFINQGVYAPDAANPCVGIDNRAAAALATTHLLELGHTRLAMVAGLTRDNDRAAARVAGFRAAAVASGLDPACISILERPYTIAGGRDGLARLLALPTRPTAILCGNDILAFGVLAEALDHGLAVPGDLSIIGFDDLELCANLRPSLSSIHIPTGEMGRLAASYLLRRLAGETPPAATQIGFSLRARQSTAPPAAASRP